VGVLIYVAARLLQPYTPSTLAFLRRTLGEKSDFVDTAYALAIGLALPLFANLTIALSIRGASGPGPMNDSVGAAWSDLMQPARRVALDWAMRKLGNDLQLLLHDAVTRPRELQLPILVTLSTNKVYVGWVTRSPNLRPEDDYLSILPLASGFRHKETLAVTLNVFYPVHEYADRGGNLSPNDFTFVIPYSAIVKANFFDVNVYVSYFVHEETSDIPPPA
jgi:hypothetical protein